jgi:hypothetical protein
MTSIYFFCQIQIGDDAKDIKCGTLIALMVAEGEDWKDVEIPAQSAAPSSGAAPAASQSAQPVQVAKKTIGSSG